MTSSYHVHSLWQQFFFKCEPKCKPIASFEPPKTHPGEPLAAKDGPWDKQIAMFVVCISSDIRFWVRLGRQWDLKRVQRAPKNCQVRKMVQTAILFNPPMKNQVFKPSRSTKIRPRGTIFGAAKALLVNARLRRGFGTPVSRSESKWSRLNPEIGGTMRKPNRKEY